MADYTPDSPATLVCIAKYAPVVATVTAVRQVNGITFLDVTYLAQEGSTYSTALCIAEGATDSEIAMTISAIGSQWYTALRWRAADAGTWFTGLTALIDSDYAPWFPPSP